MKLTENDPLKTRITLLDRIRNLENEEAWREFVWLYRPLIVRFSIGWKVSPTDAEDIAQNTLVWVAARIKDYEYRPETCPFRAWLLKKVRYLISDRFREIEKICHGPDYDDEDESGFSHPPLEQLPDMKSSEWDERWEKEHQRAVLEAASQIVRRQVPPKSFQAFDMNKIQGQPAEAVAQKLGMTTEAVHLAVFRVKEKLTQEIARLEKEFD